MNYLAMAQVFSEWFQNNGAYSDFDQAGEACYAFLELLGFDSSEQPAVMDAYWPL